MALTEMIFGEKKLGRVGVVQFDAIISESHTDDATITDHPVAVGSDITDHIRMQPEQITLTGMITNTPIVFLSSILSKSPVGTEVAGTFFPSTVHADDRVDEGYSKLRELQSSGTLVNVFTTLRSYEDMAIVTLSVNRDVQKGKVLEISITLRKIVIAKSLSVSLPDPVKIANKKKKNDGTKQTGDATKKQGEKAKGLLKKAADALGSFFG